MCISKPLLAFPRGWLVCVQFNRQHSSGGVPRSHLQTHRLFNVAVCSVYFRMCVCLRGRMTCPACISSLVISTMCPSFLLFDGLFLSLSGNKLHPPASCGFTSSFFSVIKLCMEFLSIVFDQTGSPCPIFLLSLCTISSSSPPPRR